MNLSMFHLVMSIAKLESDLTVCEKKKVPYQILGTQAELLIFEFGMSQFSTTILFTHTDRG